MNNKNSSTTSNLKIKVKHNIPSYVNTFITIYNLLQKNSKKQQPMLTSLQTELLFLYAQEPSEKQMKQLGVFLFYLFADDYYNLEPKQVDLQAKKKLPVKREQLTPFQNKLLNAYDHEPTEEQMIKLKEFLFKLFNNLLNKFDVKQEAEMVA